MTWITDANGNRASVERWGSEEAARAALATLEDCFGCSDCSDCSGCSGSSGCSDCSGCSRCSGCSDCSGCSGLSGSSKVEVASTPLPIWSVPIVPDLHKRIYAAASAPGALDMVAWHTCANTHCRAGWAVALAGAKGKALETHFGTCLAAMKIYDASCPGFEINPCRFFDDNQAALEDMRKLAEAL